MSNSNNVEKFGGEEVTVAMLGQAAELFNNHYGVWGPLAEQMHPSFEAGKRVKMSITRLRTQVLPSQHLSKCTYVRLLDDGKVIGNVFSCKWIYDGRNIIWVTQLVVDSAYRGKGVAKKLLSALREKGVRGYGIASSHAHACMAAYKAFGRSGGSIDLQLIQDHAAGIMAASPIPYIKDGKLHGRLFDNTVDDGSISSIDTTFFVDHTEPKEALDLVRKAGIAWPFGELMDGCEFLVILKPHSERKDRSSDF